MAIEYKFGGCLASNCVQELYSTNGWTIYTDNMPRLMAALNNSAVYTAWDGQRLIGLLRAVGDEETILYIQDILVLKAYQRRGIGSALLKRVLDAYPHVRQKVLLTDDKPETRSFYQANNFQSCDDGRLVAFARFD